MRLVQCLAIFGAALIICTPGQARAKVDCNAAFNYRDMRLTPDFKAAVQKKEIQTQFRATLQKETDALNDIALWHTSDIASLKDNAILHVKTIVDLISDLLGLDPATAEIKITLDASKTTVVYFVNGLNTSNDVVTLVGDGFTVSVLTTVLKDGDQLEKGAAVLIDFEQNIRAIIDASADRDTLKKQISDELASIKAQVDVYNQKMIAFENDIAAISVIKSAIAQDCDSPFFGNWLGNNNSGNANYGNGACAWNASMAVHQFSISVNERGQVIGANLGSLMNEHTIHGGCGPLGSRNESYGFTGGNISGNTIQVSFSGSPNNVPKNNAVFVGTLNGGNITGNVQFHRNDQSPQLNWSILSNEQLHR